jgi:micrococcal nuclease
VRILVLASLLAFPLACGGTPRGDNATVRTIVDGDTIVLTDGRRVRLVQLDAPEPDQAECYSRAATRELAKLIPAGTDIELETDPALGAADEFGRTLAYVQRGGTNVNVELVRRGAAAPWFYEGVRGRHAAQLLLAADEARRHDRGLWGACPGAVLDPRHPAQARP